MKPLCIAPSNPSAPTISTSKFLQNIFYFQIVVQEMQFRIFIIVRPGACEFIETMSEYFDVILWTASLREYADPVMDRIDKNRRASRRLFRESCTLLASGLTKDLTILDLNLKDVIIVDNSENSFRLQPSNAYKISDFLFDPTDRELAKITPFFIWINSLKLDDVRSVQQNFANFVQIHGINSDDDPQFEDQQMLQEYDRSLKSSSRIKQSRRLLLQKLESLSRTPNSSTILPTPLRKNSNHQQNIDKPLVSKSMTLRTHKPEFNQALATEKDVPNINSPHPERGKPFKVVLNDSEEKAGDEMESQEQTCLEEEIDDQTDKN